MSQVWDTLVEIQHLLEDNFSRTGQEVNESGMERFNQPGWVNRVWTSDRYRRAHIDVVDARETKGLWMMHCCVFPHTHNSAPIFGFDVIAGKNKITGCFIDYSPTGDFDHPMIGYFADEVGRYDWNKPRKLPEWAERIFSPHMIAAGNVSDESELAQIASLAHILVNHYTECVGETNNTSESTKNQQNRCSMSPKKETSEEYAVTECFYTIGDAPHGVPAPRVEHPH